jgi:hypothetical protein
MPAPPRKSGRQRRRRAKITLDFATGEVHDRALDAAADAGGDPGTIAQAESSAAHAAAPDDALSPEELSNEDRAQLGVEAPSRGRRARTANQQSRRRWVKARKVP